VLCRTGALAADGVGERIALWIALRVRVRVRVRLSGAPPDALLDLGTVWVGGAVDRVRRERAAAGARPDTGTRTASDTRRYG
jgi:hypothetical protein